MVPVMVRRVHIIIRKPDLVPYVNRVVRKTSLAIRQVISHFHEQQPWKHRGSENEAMKTEREDRLKTSGQCCYF